MRVYAYLDSDDPALPDYQKLQHAGPFHAVLGPRHSITESINHLASLTDEPIIGMIPDDAVFVGGAAGCYNWDLYANSIADAAAGRIAVISPRHNYGRHVDMPFVSREWFRLFGYFAHPLTKHFAWPTIIGMLAECASCIVHAEPTEFSTNHQQEASYKHEAMTEDVLAMMKIVLGDWYDKVDQIREAMDAA